MNITVCIGSSCHLKGSRVVVECLEAMLDAHGLKDRIALCGSFCTGNCQTGVSVLLDGEYHSLTPENAERFVLEQVLPRLRALEGEMDRPEERKEPLCPKS